MCKGNNVHFIQSIERSSDRVCDMLNTLLDFFRLDNDKGQPRPSLCRISTITHIFETEFISITMDKGLSLTIKNGNDAVLLTDRERIIQIGNNLLSNAIKFTEYGSVALSANFDNNVLTLVVEDTGTGMTDFHEAEGSTLFFDKVGNLAIETQ